MLRLATPKKRLPGAGGGFLTRGGAACGAAGGGAGGAPAPGGVAAADIAATPAMVNYQNIIDYTTKLGALIYYEGCRNLEFDMKSNGTAVYTSPSSKPSASKWGGTLASNKSSTLPTPLAPPSTSPTSTARLMLPRSKLSAKTSARALGLCSSQG